MERSKRSEEIVLLLGYTEERYGRNMENKLPYYQPLFGSDITHSLDGFENYVLVDASKYKKDEYDLNDIEQVRKKAEDVTGVVLCESLLLPKKLEKYHLQVKKKTR